MFLRSFDENLEEYHSRHATSLGHYMGWPSGGGNMVAKRMLDRIHDEYK